MPETASDTTLLDAVFAVLDTHGIHISIQKTQELVYSLYNMHLKYSTATVYRNLWRSRNPSKAKSTVVHTMRQAVYDILDIHSDCSSIPTLQERVYTKHNFKVPYKTAVTYRSTWRKLNSKRVTPGDCRENEKQFRRDMDNDELFPFIALEKGLTIVQKVPIPYLEEWLEYFHSIHQCRNMLKFLQERFVQETEVSNTT